ncbi:integral membrane protein [Microdochium bolleyi]|uniref:Integral membrane protein n=1 Tax=Microdochium bolleyi TaxID=196109 RepID=A0A136IQD2_9PEZI|nr:integral membrane protein [Microdochium bolleyi]
MVRFTVETGAQRRVFGFALAFAILSTIFVSLRILTNRLAHRALDASDYCIVAACIFVVGFEACSITAVLNCGVGLHMLDIVSTHGPAPIAEFAQLLVALQNLWVLSLSFCKISMLLLYTRIFSVPALVLTARLTAGFIVAWATATVLATFLICQPFAYNWDKTVPDGHCGDQVLLLQVTGALNIFTDLMVVLLPLPLLCRLEINLCQRLVLLAEFSLGLLTCVVSAVRLYTLISMDYRDITYTIPKVNILSGLEPAVAIILACVIMLRPLTRRESYTRDGSRNNTTTSSKSKGRGLGGASNGESERWDNDSDVHLRPLRARREIWVMGSKNASHFSLS